MSYMNPMMNPYGGFQPFQPQQPIYQQPQKQVEKLNGRNAAMQYPMGPNCSAWILDESGVISWLITTDSAGYKTVMPYDINPHKEAPAPDYNNLESRIKRLEDMINGRNTTDSSAAGEKQHYADDSAGKTNNEYGSYRSESAGNAAANRIE